MHDLKCKCALKAVDVLCAVVASSIRGILFVFVCCYCCSACSSVLVLARPCVGQARVEWVEWLPMDEHGGRYPSRRRLEPCRGMLPQDAAAGRRACACCFAVVGFLTPTSLRAATAGRTHTRGALQRSELGLYPGLLAAAPVAQNGVAPLRRLTVVLHQLPPGQGQLHLCIGVDTAAARDMACERCGRIHFMRMPCHAMHWPCTSHARAMPPTQSSACCTGHARCHGVQLLGS